MGFFFAYALIAWLPFSVVVMLTVRPIHRAAIFLTLAGWLFLPVMRLPISGLPDYDKFAAISLGVLLGTLVADPRRLAAFRPRWIDLPVAVWCLCPIATSLANDLGLYDGVSTSFTYVVWYG